MRKTKHWVKNAAYQLWMVYENDHLQYELGLMDEEIWLSKLAAMRYLFNRCEFQAVNERALTFSSAKLTMLWGARMIISVISEIDQ